MAFYSLALCYSTARRVNMSKVLQFPKAKQVEPVIENNEERWIRIAQAMNKINILMTELREQQARKQPTHNED